MNYTQKLTLSMLVPTVMVAGAGSAVVIGAWWLQDQARTESATVISRYLGVGAELTAGLTMLCVVACIIFTLWIRRTAKHILGGDPSDAQLILGALADGNLRISIPHAEPGSLFHSLQQLVSVLQSTIGNIRNATQAIANASSEIASGNQDLSMRTEQTAADLQHTSSATAQLNASVQHNADSARQANQAAQNASSVASAGGAVVSRVVGTMKEISESSKKIADIIGVIDGIAFQTNILALNAAVEAARAGEQGRGFAVVASEVRLLAGRSAEAAKEIKSLITASVTCVEQGAALVDQAGSTMEAVVSSIRQVTHIMGEISAANSEQSVGVTQVVAAVSRIDQTTQQNAALVEEMAAAASSMHSMTDDLVRAVAIYQVAH